MRPTRSPFLRRGGLIRCFMVEWVERRRGAAAAGLENDAGSSNAAASVPKPRLLILLLLDMLGGVLGGNEKRPTGRGGFLPGLWAVGRFGYLNTDQRNL